MLALFMTIACTGADKSSDTYTQVDTGNPDTAVTEPVEPSSEDTGEPEDTDEPENTSVSEEDCLGYKSPPVIPMIKSDTLL